MARRPQSIPDGDGETSDSFKGARLCSRSAKNKPWLPFQRLDANVLRSQTRARQLLLVTRRHEWDARGQGMSS